MLSWSATRTRVKCPYQLECSAEYHNFETLPIAPLSRNGSCQTWNKISPITFVFPGTNHPLAKGITHELDRDRQEWRAVGVKEDNEQPSSGFNPFVQASGGMSLVPRSPRPPSQWETEPFQLSELYSSLRKRAEMHTKTDGPDRTIGCLYRGPSYPPIFAVSDWKNSELTGQDGCLTRSRWTKKAVELARLVIHELPPHKRDCPLQSGSYHACHVEKQLLAFLIWNHSTLLGDVECPEEVEGCELRPWQQLEYRIYIFKQDEEATVCEDCLEFWRTVNEYFGLEGLICPLTENGEVRGLWNLDPEPTWWPWGRDITITWQ